MEILSCMFFLLHRIDVAVALQIINVLAHDRDVKRMKF